MAESVEFENQAKEAVFKEWLNRLEEHDIRVVGSDSSRPWGGFLVIDETQAEKFMQTFFDEDDPVEMQEDQKLSPKILIVEPDKRLSWQYHDRRAEAWKVVEGPVGFICSKTDEQSEMMELQTGAFVQFPPQVRHRLVGVKDEYGIVAEFWQHVDPKKPSDEDDIVRVEDDFGR